MDESSGFVTYVWGAVIAVGTTLTTAVAFLFKLNESRNNQAIADLKTDVVELKKHVRECEEDRIKLLKQNAVLSDRMGDVENRLDNK